MSVHLQIELSRLKRLFLRQAAIVEEHVRLSAQAVLKREDEAANRVLERDAQVDRNEVEIEEECLKILALHQPVAVDLRFIISVLKINSDLERISDLAVSLARHALKLNREAPLSLTLPLKEMADLVINMLKSSLDALINLNSSRAHGVIAGDKEVDALHNGIKDELTRRMQTDPTSVPVCLHLLQVSRRFERIGDHATNIAEDVIYMVDAEIVRHQPEEA